jgi:hypothetical protein
MSTSGDESPDHNPSSDDDTAAAMPTEPTPKDDEELELERLVFGAPADFADRVARFSESDRRKRLGLDADGPGAAGGDAALEELADDDVSTFRPPRAAASRPRH